MSALKITRNDILPMETYAAERKERRRKAMEVKRPRRVEVGPFATFYFENYDTMFQQIHEMLFIEQGGEEQIEDELAAYNPLIPQGSELVATLMFEIEDAARREAVLKTLTHVEETVYIAVNGENVMADAEHDVERTAPDGKTSSVHFLKFPFSKAQIDAFKAEGAEVVVGIDHENYGHMARLSKETVASLSADFA